MLFSLREKKATLGDRKHRQLPIFGDEPSESCEDRPTLENYRRIAAYPPNSYKIRRCLSMISPAYFPRDLVGCTQAVVVPRHTRTKAEAMYHLKISCLEVKKERSDSHDSPLIELTIDDMVKLGFSNFGY